MRAAERAAILDGISRQRGIVTAALRQGSGTQAAAQELFRLSLEAQGLGISARTIRRAGGLGVQG